MIAKLALLFAAIAASSGTGLIGAGLLTPGLIAPAAVRTGTVVAIPGAVTTDKRVIGAVPVIAGAPLLANGVLANGLIGNGIIGAAPIGIAPWGAGIIAAPGIAKTIL